MAEFEIPEDVTSLDDEQLSSALDGARNAFAALSAESTVTDTSMTRLRALSTCVEDIRTEQGARVEAATAAASEIEQLARPLPGSPRSPTTP